MIDRYIMISNNKGKAERPFIRKVFQMTNKQRFNNFQRWEKLVDRKFNLKQQRQAAWLKEIEEVAQ